MPHHALKCRILRHEPLEERQLLAVDSGLNALALSASESMAAIFPQPRGYYVSGQSASVANPNAANPNAVNRDETALVPAGIFADENASELATDATTDSKRLCQSQ